MDLKSILNMELLKQAMRKDATMPQIGMSSVPQGVVDRAMQLIGNLTHFRVIQVNCTRLRLVQLLDCYWYNYSRGALKCV